ncbi:MAG: hypothetical protein JW982_06445 [Spirochaetes bacterium]|nr:hypothetical protein [Spirochaetota bacterium]
MKKISFLLLLALIFGSSYAGSTENLALLSYNEMMDFCQSADTQEEQLFYGEFYAVRIFPLSGNLATSENSGKLVLMADLKQENKKVLVLFPKEQSAVFQDLIRIHGKFEIVYKAETVFNKVYPVLDLEEFIVK